MKLRLETCARVAEIAGAIAVVMSVIYLAVQISDNTRLLRSQAHSSALSLMQRPLEIMLENEGLAHIVSQCNARPTEVSDEHWERCLNYYFMQFNGWEYSAGPNDTFEAWPVSRAVNKPKNQGPQLIGRI
jgi:hypothetical protein